MCYTCHLYCIVFKGNTLFENLNRKQFCLQGLLEEKASASFTIPAALTKDHICMIHISKCKNSVLSGNESKYEK